MRGSLLQGSALSMHAIVTVVQMYAPTESASDGEKDLFYDQLQDVLDDIPSHHIKLIMGDFNAKLDGNRQGFTTAKKPHGSADLTNK